MAAAAAADRIHPILSSGRGGKNSFGYVRSLVSSVLALAKPSEAITVKTDYIGKAFTRLTGKKLFKNAVMSADEYQALLDLAFDIRTELTKWDWKPRDLWDVQGFLWVVADYPEGPAPPTPPISGQVRPAAPWRQAGRAPNRKSGRRSHPVPPCARPIRRGCEGIGGRAGSRAIRWPVE